MAPAVGPTGQEECGDGGQQPMPPTPPSNHSELGNGPTAMGPQTAPAGYPQQPAMGPPPHMMYNSKMPPGSGSAPPPPGQAPPPHPSQQQQQPMHHYGGQPGPNYGQYGPRPAYGPGPGGYPGGYSRPNNIPPGYPSYPQQYPGAWSNSSGPPPQQQHGMMPMGGKGAPPPPPGAPGAPSPQRHPGAPPPPSSPSQQGQYPPRPHHPQMMKGGYPPTSGGPPPNNSYNGPPMYNGPGMTPPSSNGPPMYNGPGMPPPPNSAPGMGGPPNQAPQGYPGSYPNAHPTNSYGPPNSSMPPSSNSGGGVSPAMSTSTTTTGPDGVPLHDESSQQSTLSQSSDRSDGRQTPKTGQSFGQAPTPGGFPPPSSPHSSAPSPGGSMGSSAGGLEGGYPRDMASPNWQRTPTSPHPMNQSNSHGGYNNSGSGAPPLSISPGDPQTVGPYTPHIPHTEPTLTPTGRISKASTKNSETLTRLYEMDENPERRMFLDRLLSFMEERGTPIVQCPTISKNPLDLYKLYMHAKERGGYLECTKNKTWKDIAAALGIGASSSGAYTLKKHYGKNLLPFECHFDKGGMDPGPILAQVEAQSKKKSKVNSAHPPPAPSPGSQDSRDSYSNSSDPYCGYPPGSGPPPSHNSYPPANSGAAQSSGPNADRPPSHPGSGYPPSSGYGYPQGGPPPGGYPPSSYPSGPRPGWPSHPGYMGGPPPPQGGGAPPPNSWPQPPSGYGPRPPYPGSQPPTTGSGPNSQGQPYSGQPPYQDQYQLKRSEQARPVILGTNSSPHQGYGTGTNSSSSPAPPYNSGTPGKGPGPGPSTAQSPRPGAPPNAYPYQGQRPPMYPGGQPQWPNRYPAPSYGPPSGDRSWPPPPGSQSIPPAGPGQWSSDRTTYYGPTGAPGSPGSWGPGKAPMRPPFRGDSRGASPMGPRQGPPGSRYRELSFPPGSVESTPPFLLKRRRYTKVEVQPVEGWRLVMALKSGLLMESTWALDILNILLYDDNGIAYFGLGNMPGLFEALLEHWRASLIAMFGITEDLEVSAEMKRPQKRRRQLCSIGDPSDPEDDELGQAKNIDADDKCVVLSTASENLTKRPRFVEEEVIVDDRDEDIFVTDEDRPWDNAKEGFESGFWQWINGGGLTTEHIVTHFAADLGKSNFVRVLKDVKKDIKVELEQSKETAVIKQEAVEDSVEEIKDETTSDDSKEEQEEDIVEKIQRMTGIVLRDPEVAREKWKQKNLEDENYMRDEPSLHLTSEANEHLGRRAVCISTILRNLSFVPGNEFDMSKNSTFLAIIGRLLLLHHWYPPRPPKQRNYDRGEEEESAESCTSLTGDDEWWWEYLHVIRENVMVILTNISGALDLEPYEQEISKPIINGLLEWAISSSAYAQDPFPYVGQGSSVSPQRCAIEALCKLCLLESNVDLILTAPVFWRIEKLTKMLAKKLYRYEDQVLREFSINMLYYLSAADTGIARTIALADTTVSLLLSFIEQAEQNAMVIAQQHGIHALRDNPDSMGTSLDMLRRAATTLNNLSRHKDNISLLARQEQRLLSLVMSQILDQGVASILSSVLYNIGAHAPPPPPPPSLPSTPPPSNERAPEVEATT